MPADTFHRAGVATLVERLRETPKRMVAVFGPRQTGKTTMVQDALRQGEFPHIYLRVDEPDDPTPRITQGERAEAVTPLNQVRDTAWLVGNWTRARQLAEQTPGGFVLVLDEIQQIPNWSRTVKGLWDADRSQGCPLHVVFMGSAPMLMQAGLSESLVGRFELIHVTHWSFPEMSEAFDLTLDQYVYFGGYPGAAPLIAEEARWRDYIRGAVVEPHLERDLLAMTRIDKPALLKNLFELGAAYSGQILAYNKMVGQLEDAGNTTTLARYLDLLSKVGLLAGLPMHSGSAQRRRKSSPKLNVLNTALMSAASSHSFDEAKADRSYWGRLVESAVGAHLLNSGDRRLEVSYWREGGLEVDFVMRRGPRVRGIEVKSGGGSPNARALQKFEREFSALPTLVVGEGGVPLNEFLSTSADEWLDQS